MHRFYEALGNPPTRYISLLTAGAKMVTSARDCQGVWLITDKVYFI